MQEQVVWRQQNPTVAFSGYALIYDGRNALDAAKMRRLGFEYMGVGRGAR